MSSTLHIHLLGDFRLTLGDRPVTSVHTARLRSLIAYLLLHRGASQPRQRLAFLFWPDSTEAQARTNLRRELHHLRRALPDADRYLRVDSRTLCWQADAPFALDVAGFEAALGRADRAEEAGDERALGDSLGAAAAAYRGDLLPSCYDAWIDPERARMRQSFEAVLDRLVAVLEARRDYAAAIRYAERRVRHDPLREAFHAHLIGLHAASGDRAAAVRAYRRCAAVLDEELGVEPGPATRAAYDRATSATAPPPTPIEIVPPAPSRSPASPPLVGRERERAVIQGWIGAMDDGDARRQTLLLLGEPGIGKTRLLEELAAQVRDAGGYVLRGRGFEAELVRPYGAWIDALRSLPSDGASRSRDLDALVQEVHDAPEAPADRSRLFDAVAHHLMRLSADGAPLAVLLDDIHWLDEASAALLHYVARLLVDAPVLLACAARPGEVEDNSPVLGFLRGLRREGRVRTIDLEPMDREHTGALAHAVNAGIDADRVFADSGGNPLFVLELARALAECASGQSASLEDLIGNRLSRLDEAAHDLLSWAAALGRGFNPSTVALVAGRPLPELLPALDQLERHGIIRPGDAAGGDTGYDFAHDVVRRTAYAQLSEPRRRLVHLRIARALAGSDDADDTFAGDVAHHAALGGDEALAAPAALAAGERCLRIFAYAEAAESARRGIAHCQRLEDHERIHRHMALLRVAVAAGVAPHRLAGLEEEIRELVAEARSLGRVDDEAIGFGLISLLNYHHDNFGRVHESTLRAAETSRTASPATTARMLGQTGACLAAIEREMPRAEALLLEARSLAERVGLEIPDIPMGLGIVRQYAADGAEATRLLEHALRLARAGQNHFHECECLTNLVMLDIDGAAFDRALAHCEELAAIAAKFREGSEIPFARTLAALARYATAQAGTADGLAEALETLRRVGACRKLAYVLTHAADVDLAAGRTDVALGRAEEALAAARAVDHRSGVALAGATLVRATRSRKDLRRAESALDALRLEVGDTRGLSARARAAFELLAGERPAPSTLQPQ